MSEGSATISNPVSPTHVARRYVPIDALPRTAHGKLDGRALESLLDARVISRGSSPSVATGGDLVAKMTEIWCSVLDMDEVYPDDDYFELGGDSLSSLTIIARCAKHNIHFSPADLLRHPTIASLCEWLALTNAGDEVVASQRGPAATTSAGKAEMLRVLKLDGRTD